MNKQTARHSTSALDFEATELWRLWRRLTAAHGVWRALLALFRPRARLWTSIDALNTVRRSRAARETDAATLDVDANVLEALRDMARLNSERQSVYLRTILIAYFTIPLGIAAVWAQIDPSGIPASLRAYPSFWGGGFAGLTTAVLGRFIHDARARDLASTLELLLAERRAKAAPASV